MLRFRGGGDLRGVGIRLSYCCRVLCLCLRALKGLFVVFCVFLERTVEFAGSVLFERSRGSVQYHADIYEKAACTFRPGRSVVPCA